MNSRNGLLDLTAREAQTFNLVVSGKKTREIAEELGISIHTALHYRRRVYEKLNICSVAGLIRCAASFGWFSRQ